ncbi:hypothetical protein LPJ56_004844, partial [Coemansia sp. RSA 2599]
WTSNGWPASQLTAGIAFYGRATTATEDMAKEPVTQYKSQSNVVPLGDKEDAPWADTCAGTGEVNSGFWQWKHLRDQGVLSSPDTAASPWIRNWDNTTQTPWLYNPDTMMFISYDDPESIQLKMDYAASKGLGGLMVWAMYMDTPDAELLTVLQSFSSEGLANDNSKVNGGIEDEKVEDEKAEDEKMEDEKAKDEKVKSKKAEDEKVKSKTAENEKAEDEEVEDEKVEDEKAKDKKVKSKKAEDEEVDDEKVEDEKAEDEKMEDEKAKDEKVKSKKAEDEEAEDEKAEDEEVEDEKAEDEKAEDLGECTSGEYKCVDEDGLGGV